MCWSVRKDDNFLTHQDGTARTCEIIVETSRIRPRYNIPKFSIQIIDPLQVAGLPAVKVACACLSKAMWFGASRVDLLTRTVVFSSQDQLRSSFPTHVSVPLSCDLLVLPRFLAAVLALESSSPYVLAVHVLPPHLLVSLAWMTCPQSYQAF
jgi:hypothetical protein